MEETSKASQNVSEHGATHSASQKVGDHVADSKSSSVAPHFIDSLAWRGSSHHEVPQKRVFDHLLAELSDNHTLTHFHPLLELPVMFIDKGQFHYYSGVSEMESKGSYGIYQGEAHKALKNSIVRVKGDKLALDNSSGKAKVVTSLVSLDPAASPAILDLSITNLVAFQWIAISVIVVTFFMASRRYKKNPKAAPRGFQNVMETLVCFIRDEVVYPNIKPRSVATKLTPYLLALFFFILAMNVIGLMPGGHAASGAIGTTAALALTAFFVVNIVAIRVSGIGAWFRHLLGGAPWYLSIIMVPIEFISLFVKPFALCIRLFANMTAGHVVILSLVGLIFFFKTWAVAPISVGFSVFIYLLETLVAFLQAFIFTMLTAVFIGMSIGDHGSEEGHAH